MICQTPLKVKNPQPNAGDFLYHKVPCGKCPICLKNRSKKWVFRLKQEQLVSSNSEFITLTYDDNNLPEDKKLSVDHLQKFFKRLRKKVFKTHPNIKLKYYACGEYGDTTQRPHYHIILFNRPLKHNHNAKEEDDLIKIWGNGHVRIDECNEATMHYVTKYISKQADPTRNKENKEFSLMSKGLGASYITEKKKEYYKNKLVPYLIDKGGEKIAMPKYYKEKLYNEEDRMKVNFEAKKFHQQSEPFRDENHKIDYIDTEFKKHLKAQQLKRKKL